MRERCNLRQKGQQERSKAGAEKRDYPLNTEQIAPSREPWRLLELSSRSETFVNNWGDLLDKHHPSHTSLKNTRVTTKATMAKLEETRQGRKYGYCFQKGPPKTLGKCS